MNFAQLIDNLNSDTLHSLCFFRPELTLCVTIVLILLMRLIPPARQVPTFLVTLVGSLVALGFAITSWNEGSGASIERQELFTGMLVYDNFTVYFRIVLLLFLAVFTLLTWISGVPDQDAGQDVYPLVLGATLGLCLMASANHLLMVFMAIEMASVPSYVMAGLVKGRRRSSEAALKYAVYGAGTAGIMLYGISLLGGVLGSFHIPTMAVNLAKLLGSGTAPVLGADQPLVLMIGGLMLMVGVAFKLSAVPFHFWCPDVFEGASAEVNAFLSVASKAGAMALLVRVAIGFGSLAPPDRQAALDSDAHSRYSATDAPDAIRSKASSMPVRTVSQTQHLPDIGATQVVEKHAGVDALRPAREFIAKLIAFLAVITCTFGNLAAYGQTNIKRLLAYSTIAHAGYMMMPVAAALVLAGRDPAAAEDALSAVTFYIAVYFFMNLGAFAVVAFLRNALGSEEIADYAGLVRQMPLVVVCFSLLLFSLIGLPPLGGFWPKLLIFASLTNAGLLAVLVIGGLNTVLSLFYYLRVVKVMTLDPEPESRLPVSFGFIPGTFVVALTLPVLYWGIWWDGISVWARAAVQNLLS